jgi:hypothetical protein
MNFFFHLKFSNENKNSIIFAPMGCLKIAYNHLEVVYKSENQSLGRGENGVGLIVSGLNHAMHQTKQSKVTTKSKDGVLPPGEMKFEDLTTDQLSEYRIIPEDAEINPIFTPTKNGTYQGDGFYHKDFSDKKYWFKVSAGSSVTITSSGGKYNYSVYQDLSMTYLAIALGKDYAVGWQPLSNHHWTANTFDLKKRY